MRLSNVSSARQNLVPASPSRLPVQDVRRWAGQVQTVQNPYHTSQGTSSTGFQGSQNVRSADAKK